MINNPNAQVLDSMLTPKGVWDERSLLALGNKAFGSQFVSGDQKVTVFHAQDLIRLSIDREKLFRKIFLYYYIDMTLPGSDYFFYGDVVLFLNKQMIANFPVESTKDVGGNMVKTSVNMFNGSEEMLTPDAIRIFPKGKYDLMPEQAYVSPLKVVMEADEAVFRLLDMKTGVTTFTGLTAWLGVHSTTHNF